MKQPEQVFDWDGAYQERMAGFEGAPGWSIGEPQPELAKLIGQGKFRSKILDAGCGAAELSLKLATLGHTVVGVDLAPSTIERATAAAAERGLATATFAQADITTLGGYDGCFATVVDSTLFHALPVHLRDAYLQAIHRAAAPGAELFILAFAHGAFTLPPGQAPYPVTEDELRDTVAKHWLVDEIRPAFIHAHVPENGPMSGSFDRDRHGRANMAAWLLSGREAS